MVATTAEFTNWIDRLRDRQGRARILLRIRRLEEGNPGKVAAVGEGVFEIKLDFGPGYRVYFMNLDGQVVILLCGGDKSSQSKDIKTAKAIARRYR